MAIFKMLTSIAATWIVVMALWFVNYYNAILAYGRKELGLIPMVILNNSFDTWSTCALIVGAIIGAVIISKKAS